MTCKDCLYFEHCHSDIAYGMGSDDLTGEYFTDIETRCKSFKDKANVVEVVRCKDCEHSTLILGTYICDNIQAPWFNDDFAIDVGANDFCSYGKRKEGAE